MLKSHVDEELIPSPVIVDSYHWFLHYNPHHETIRTTIRQKEDSLCENNKFDLEKNAHKMKINAALKYNHLGIMRGIRFNLSNNTG